MRGLDPVTQAVADVEWEEIKDQVLPWSMRTRVATTEQIIALNNKSINRMADPYALLNLDPNGKHFVQRQQFIFQPFARCQVALKVVHRYAPVLVWIDMTDEDYDALPMIANMVKED